MAKMTSEVAERDEKPKPTGPLTFMREVRAEARKITWATRQEVTVSTLMVLVLSVVAAIFFFVVDFLLRAGVGAILGLGG
jgi:preprotein translocase subunit SecE